MTPLPDVQQESAAIALPINQVGVSDLAFRLRLLDRESGQREVIARASVAVSLPATRRGAHMSRLVEALDHWQGTLGCQSMREFLSDVQQRLEAPDAFADFKFQWLARRAAPISGHSAATAYDCAVSATLHGDKLTFRLGIAVPVMTVCPCSLAMSVTGAHCQRALVHLHVSCRRFIWLEDLITLAEQAGSAPVYPLLKRPDEKFITELAFSQAAFVEDVARSAASAVGRHPHALAWTVRVESMESIHSHNAFAHICGQRGGE